MRFKIAAVAALTALLASCAKPGKNEPGPGPRPAPVQEDACPVAGMSDDQIRGVMERARAVRDEAIVGMKVEAKAGWLAYELSAAGVSQARMQAALNEGKFFALVTWLGDGVNALDINKIRKCEEF